MKYLFLDTIPQLQPLLDFDLKEINIDLHNDFDFVEIIIQDSTLELMFKRTNMNLSYKEENAAIIFHNVLEHNFNKSMGKQIEHSVTLMNFAKGSFTDSHKYSKDKAVAYFFLEFENSDIFFEVFCNSAIIILW